MARKRIEETKTLNSWDDVNLSLAEIIEHQIAIEATEAKMQQIIADAKLAAEMAAKPHQEAIVRLEAIMQSYFDDHKEELGDKKTMVLNNGEVGYRKSTKAVLPTARALLDDIIAKLRARKMTECIISKPETVDKEAVKKYPAATLAEIGIILKVKDVFGYKVNRETLKPET